MPLVALSMVVLMGFAALAVDVGMGYSERRTSQGSADASAMAAAVDVLLGSTSVQLMVTDAVVYAETNLPGGLTEADWLTRCPDTVRPEDQLAYTAADLGLTPATDCISFSYGFDTIRVSLPERAIDTYFASVLGIDSYDVSAFAHATIRYEGVMSTPPFVVTAGTEAGEVRCLRASAIPGHGALMPPRWVGNGPGNPPTLGIVGDVDDADSCDDTVFDRETQFFGSLKAWNYEDCTQPSGNNAIAVVIADGIDHRLGSFEPDYKLGDPELVDGDGCIGVDPVPQPYPNTIELQTGYTAKLLMLGLLSTDVATPRLKRGDHVQSTYQFGTQDMDNTPLWEYLRSDIADVSAPAECKTVYAEKDNILYDHFDLKELMLECLVTWKNNPSDEILFADSDDPTSPSITTSGRFAWLPILAESSLNGLVGKNVHMNAFVPVFIDTLYQISRKTTQSSDCWTQHPAQHGNLGWSRHQPGQEFDCGLGGNNAQISAVAAVVIACGALPDTICIDDSVSSGPSGEPIEIIELSR